MKNKKTFDPKPRLSFHSEAVDDMSKWPAPILPPKEGQKPNLIGSLCSDGMHRPAIDIDMPCQLIPSTTEGHFHLYIDKSVSHGKYRKWFDTNGMTTLRPPSVKKTKKSGSSAGDG